MAGTCTPTRNACAADRRTQALGVRVSLFMDPVPEAMAQARELGADRVELYTESYARAHGTPAQAERLAALCRRPRARRWRRAWA